jgi:hypothetical protein
MGDPIEHVLRSMKYEAHEAGRRAAVAGRSEAAEGYAEVALEAWGELLPEVTAEAMESAMSTIVEAYRKGYELGMHAHWN